MGKTSMLTHLEIEAVRRGKVRVITARGVESEAVLPFPAIAELLLPLRQHF
jgi:hypothetical protein